MAMAMLDDEPAVPATPVPVPDIDPLRRLDDYYLETPVIRTVPHEEASREKELCHVPAQSGERAEDQRGVPSFYLRDESLEECLAIPALSSYGREQHGVRKKVQVSGTPDS